MISKIGRMKCVAWQFKWISTWNFFYVFVDAATSEDLVYATICIGPWQSRWTV